MNQLQKNVFSKFKFEEVRLNEITEELKAGFSSGKFELNNGDIAHLRPMNIDNDCKLTWVGTKYISHSLFKEKQEYKLKEGDILFNNTNSTELVGKSCYIKEDLNCGFSNHMTRIRVNSKKANSIYLSNLFSGMFTKRIFETYCHKWVGQSGINTVILSNIPILIPSLTEQNQIAELFQCIEIAIEHAEQQARNLVGLRKYLINRLTKKNPTFSSFISGKCVPVNVGKVAKEISDRVDNPSKSEYKQFVGLEDFESGELRINKYSSTENLLSAMKLFKSGDVLFARRNVYLKRVSQAIFDGVCSGDAIVMRAKKEIILAEFLTLILNTNEFWDYALSNAAGAFSKRIKWRELEIYSFDLPDLETQEKILEVFQEIQSTLYQITLQKQALKNLKQKLLNEILG